MNEFYRYARKCGLKAKTAFIAGKWFLANTRQDYRVKQFIVQEFGRMTDYQVENMAEILLTRYGK